MVTNQEKADIKRKVDEALNQEERDYGDWPDYQLRTTQDGRIEQVA